MQPLALEKGGGRLHAKWQLAKKKKCSLVLGPSDCLALLQRKHSETRFEWKILQKLRHNSETVLTK